MPERDFTAGGVLACPVDEHPAARAFRALRPDGATPERIEVLKGARPGARRSAYRLAGVGPGGSAVIAKRCPVVKARLERDVYEQVLPSLPVPTVRYYGFVEHADGGWLFLEDVGGHPRYSPDIHEHRRAAGRWLGFLHTRATPAAAARLPVLDSAYYFDRLRSGRARIESALSAPLEPVDQSLMRTILSQCALLEAKWPAVEGRCRSMPKSLIHGDFVAKNIYVAAESGPPRLLPLDWGQAGRGLPGVDLAQSLPSCHGLSADIDLEAYLEVVRGHWAGIGMPEVRAWARTGTLLRTLVAVEWASRSLGRGMICGATAWLGAYADQLAHAARALEGQ